MAFVHGSNATLSIDGTAITVYTDSVSFSRTTDTAEVTVFTNDDKNFIAGLRGATLSCSGPFDATGHGVLNGCFDQASVAFSYSPDGGTTTIAGNCFITDYTPTSPVGDRDSWSAAFTITGALS